MTTTDKDKLATLSEGQLEKTSGGYRYHHGGNPWAAYRAARAAASWGQPYYPGYAPQYYAPPPPPPGPAYYGAPGYGPGYGPPRYMIEHRVDRWG